MCKEIEDRDKVFELGKACGWELCGAFVKGNEELDKVGELGQDCGRVSKS